MFLFYILLETEVVELCILSVPWRHLYYFAPTGACVSSIWNVFVSLQLKIINSNSTVHLPYDCTFIIRLYICHITVHLPYDCTFFKRRYSYQTTRRCILLKVTLEIWSQILQKVSPCSKKNGAQFKNIYISQTQKMICLYSCLLE